MSETVTTAVATLSGNLYSSIQLPINDLNQTFTYSGTSVLTASVTYQGVIYTQTFTYTGTNVTGISQWTPTGLA
jgi:hypothetical protein